VVSDRCKQRNAEEAVRDGEARFRAIFEQTGIGMAIVGVDDRYHLVNQRLCDMLGYTREELEARTFRDITHEEDLAADLDYDRRIRAREIGESTRTKRYIRKDGSVCWVRLTVSMVSSPSGEPDYFIAAIEDRSAQKMAEDALRQSEERYRAITETASDAIVTIDSRSRIVFANSATERLFGYSTSHLLGKSLTLLMPERLRKAHLAGMLRYRKTGKRGIPWTNVALVGRHQNGAEIPLELSFGTHLQNGHRVLTGIIRDTSERKRVEEELRRSEARFRATVDRAAVGISQVDMEGRWLFVNDRLCEIYGYSRAELSPLRFHDITHPDDLAADLAQLSRLADGEIESYSLEKRFIRNGGMVIWANLTVSMVRDDTGTPEYTIAVIEDITSRKGAETRLQHQALHDPLTDLPNRSLLQDRLRHAIAGAERGNTRLALLLMDLDRFKEVNDTFGHHCGDLLLREVADRLRRALRASDTMARLGGDEFAVLLEGAAEAGAHEVAAMLVNAIGQPFFLKGQLLYMRASVGIALYPEHGRDAESLLRRSDIAMYQAKRTESESAVYDQGQDLYSPDRLALEGDLRRAIDEEALTLHFQPQLELRTGRVVRVEVLVRWAHAQRGLLTPDQFIPLAEHTGLIKPLAAWVLNAALRQCRRWLDAGIEVGIAVNMSVRNLIDPSLVDSVTGLLARWRVEPRFLQLEITESGVMADPDRAIHVLTALRDIGVSSSMDDFGMGHSSLAHLMRLPASEVKIDRSFVLDMARDENAATIVRATISLAHELGLSVVAEGVEDEVTRDVLADYGCDVVQGYWLSRPLSADLCTRWLQSWSRQLVSSRGRVPATARAS
jgi:diguanylate cyclase (GGDEF)-like protein/PAS domain S-box-containing protein